MGASQLRGTKPTIVVYDEAYPRRSIEVIWNKHTRLNSRVEIVEAFNDGFTVLVKHVQHDSGWVGHHLWLPMEMLRVAVGGELLNIDALIASGPSTVLSLG